MYKCTKRIFSAKHLFIVFLMILTCGVSYASDAGNILINGDLNKDNNNDGWPDAWRKVPRAYSQSKDGNRWILLEKKSESSGGVVTTQKVNLEPEWTSVNLRARVKLTEVKQGLKRHHNARTLVTFYDTNNKRVGPWPKVFSKTGTTDWIECNLDFEIPEHARFVVVGFGLWGVGKVEVDDFVLTASSKPVISKKSSKSGGKDIKLTDAVLPAGVKAVWDMSKAYRVKNDLREEICINGLWKWRPAKTRETKVPAAGTGWGYYKVPAAWRGVHHWLGVDSNKAFEVQGWSRKYGYPKNTMAWYQREITTPQDWSDNRVALSMENLNSYAMVYVDGKSVGEAYFPAGEVDLTKFIKPGQKQVLSIFAAAIPLNSDIYDYSAADHKAKRKATVLFKGLCGDVFLKSYPQNTSIEDVKVETSVENKKLNLRLEFKDFDKDKKYILSGSVIDGKDVALKIEDTPVSADLLKNKKLQVSVDWKNPKLWDLHTPQNQYKLKLLLKSEDGKVIDETLPLAFGFREVQQKGRDFYLNGKRVRMFSLPIDSARISNAMSSYKQARETIKRFKSMGVNMLYTHNHNCLPGTHVSFSEILKAANDEGMLIAMSLPHMKDYKWSKHMHERNNGYANHISSYIKMSQNHPSIAMYALNHNYAGYKADQDPLRLGTDYMPDKDFRGGKGLASKERRERAAHSVNIVKRYDNTRLIYNHSSGNTKEMCTLNNYLDFVPIQERSDWFEHWSKNGIMPLFLVEYGDPIYANFTFFRGEYRGTYTTFFRMNMLNQYFYPEWGSSFRGHEAYKMIEPEKRRLRFEAKKWRQNKPFRSYSYPDHVNGILISENEDLVRAKYLYENLPAFRTFGVSAYNIWEFNRCWNIRKGVNALEEQALATDWDNLQQPGFSADYVVPTLMMPYSFKLSDWKLNNRGKAYMRGNNRVLAWLAGHREKFTSRDHNFFAGEKIEKQVIVVNDHRETVECDFVWQLDLDGKNIEGSGSLSVEPGNHKGAVIDITLPESIAPGSYKLSLECTFKDGEVQKDQIQIDVVAKPEPIAVNSGIALFDPIGETAKLLDGRGVKYTKVGATDKVDGYEILIIGKKVITIDSKLPNISGVKDGLKVIIFEQTAQALEKRFGFRVQEFGLRNAFARISDHDLLKGISNDNLINWRGAATLISKHVPEYANPGRYPLTSWSGYTATRPWRAGNYGNISSVMINKPNIGDFTPIIDGGFSLQYSPLMLYREGKGSILFCQLDVTGRTAMEPAAEVLVSNILNYTKKGVVKEAAKSVLYAGKESGFKHLQASGLNVEKYTGGTLKANTILVVGGGSAGILTSNKAELEKWLSNNGRIVAVGLNAGELKSLPAPVSSVQKEYISSLFKSPNGGDVFAAVSSADIHNREPKMMTLLTDDVKVDENGLIGKTSDEKVILIQLAPWDVEHEKLYNLKPTFIRLSYTLNRVLANSDVAMSSPMIERVAETTALPKATLTDYINTIAIKDKAGKTLLLPAVWKGLPVKDGATTPENWKSFDFDASAWRNVKVPGKWEEQFDDLAAYDGVFLYRLEFDLPETFLNKELKIFFGAIDDEDHTYVNNTLIGSTTKMSNPKNYWEFKREYSISSNILKPGKNVITVRVNDIWQHGGIFGYKVPDKDRLQIIADQFGQDMRWMSGFYLTLPVPYDDPYRYFRW